MWLSQAFAELHVKPWVRFLGKNELLVYLGEHVQNYKQKIKTITKYKDHPQLGGKYIFLC